mmetsp:Transcript_23220/g.78634  ORF Transcript_23220/g.78634 Transcript_23220/m.78634 type:complete len:251 (-) Transcript_23220:356-1108(-)
MWLIIHNSSMPTWFCVSLLKTGSPDSHGFAEKRDGCKASERMISATSSSGLWFWKNGLVIGTFIRVTKTSMRLNISMELELGPAGLPRPSPTLVPMMLEESDSSVSVVLNLLLLLACFARRLLISKLRSRATFVGSTSSGRSGRMAKGFKDAHLWHQGSKGMGSSAIAKSVNKALDSSFELPDFINEFTCRVIMIWRSYEDLPEGVHVPLALGPTLKDLVPEVIEPLSDTAPSSMEGIISESSSKKELGP